MRPMRRLQTLVLLLAASASGGTMEDVFARIQAAQAGVNTLEARFEQTKRSTLFDGEAVATGVMSYRRPDRVRWEYLAPERYTVLIEGDRLRVHYPQLNKLKTARVARLRHRALSFMLATEPLEKLKTHFQVELREGGGRPAWTLVLTPMTAMLRKSLARVTVLVDKTTGLPSELLIEEADGDSTRLRFSAVAANPALPDDRFILRVPPGTVEEPYTPGGR